MSNVIYIEQWIRYHAARAHSIIEQYPPWVDLTSIVTVVMPGSTSECTKRIIAEYVGWQDHDTIEAKQTLGPNGLIEIESTMPAWGSRRSYSISR